MYAVVARHLHHYESVSWAESLPVVTTERLVLRISDEADLDELVAFSARNVEHLRPWFPANALSPTREGLLNSTNEKREQAKGDRGYRFHLFLREDPKRVVGQCSVSDVRRGAIQQAVIGYAIDHGEQGKGLMKEAVSAAVKFAFDDLDLHRLEGSYMLANDVSGAILHKLGFQQEAIFKEYLFLNNAWQDHIVTSLINAEWKGTGRKIS